MAGCPIANNAKVKHRAPGCQPDTYIMKFLIDLPSDPVSSHRQFWPRSVISLGA